MFKDFAKFLQAPKFTLHLLAVSVGLPESDTVLFGDVPALWQQLGVGDGLLALGAALLDELLRRQLRLRELLRLLARLALLVRNHLKKATSKKLFLLLPFVKLWLEKVNLRPLSGF